MGNDFIMMGKSYFVVHGDNDQYILYRKDSVSDNYVMSFKYKVEADEVCNLLNKEEIRVKGFYDSEKEMQNKLNDMTRLFFKYRTAIEKALIKYEYEVVCPYMIGVVKEGDCDVSRCKMYNYVKDVVDEYKTTGDIK